MKTRLTITLSESTLKKLDQLIDKRKIRNRSHAIEFVLEQHLRPTIKTAVILAGGPEDGTTDEPFRPVTMLDGKPLITHTIEHLRRFGVEKVLIATSKAGKSIQDILGDGSDYQMNFEYFFEDEPLGTAGAIANTRSQLPNNEPFYVIAGDVLTTIDLDDFREFHTKHRGLLTMAVKPRVTKSSYDNVFIQGHTVVDFQKSKPDQQVSIVNAGVYIMHPKVLEFIPETRPSMLEEDVFPKLAKQQKLVAFTFQGIWFDITSDTNYKTALEQISSTK